MNEEMRLISMGIPVEDAIFLCFSLRKEGCLDDFMVQWEAEYNANFGSDL